MYAKGGRFLVSDRGLCLTLALALVPRSGSFSVLEQRRAYAETCARVRRAKMVRYQNLPKTRPFRLVLTILSLQYQSHILPCFFGFHFFSLKKCLFFSLSFLHPWSRTGSTRDFCIGTRQSRRQACMARLSGLLGSPRERGRGSRRGGQTDLLPSDPGSEELGECIGQALRPGTQDREGRRTAPRARRRPARSLRRLPLSAPALSQGPHDRGGTGQVPARQ